MARASLELIMKLIGVDKAGRQLDDFSRSTKKVDTTVKNTAKSNKQFAAGMSSLSKGAIAGAALFAGKQLLDFSLASIQAASAAQEASGAFGTTFGDEAAKLGEELSKNANLFGLTTSEAKQLVGVFGAVAQGIGFTQSESADLSSRLFTLAGDIASFNNVSQGALPVLQAFRNAIVGERESLATYGIKLLEVEVQQKALNMGLADTVAALTIQDKALATTELIFEKAAVQIGNAERESEGFAAQLLQTRAATTELKEEVGAELLPAAGELLNIFNNFVEDVSPAVVKGFGFINDAILISIDATEEAGNIFTNLVRDYILGQKALRGNADAQEEFLKATEKTNEILNEQSVQIISNTGFSQDFTNLLGMMSKANLGLFISQQKTRLGTLTNEVQQKKLADTLKFKVNPIFGEQNSLLLTNIAIESERAKLQQLIATGAADVAEATQLRNQAARDVARLTLEENLRDAEAAVRKNELTTQIGILTRAQESGKEVTAELALAQAELALVEDELINDSPLLIAARERLELAEDKLTQALAREEAKRKEVREQLLGEIDDLDANAAAKERNRKKTQQLADEVANALRLFRELERQTFDLSDFGLELRDDTPDPFIPPDPTPGDNPFVSDQGNISGGETGKRNGNQEVRVVVELSDTAEDFLTTTQKSVNKKGFSII